MNAQTQLILHSDHSLITAGLTAVLSEEGGLALLAKTDNAADLLDQVDNLLPQVVIMGVAHEDPSLAPLIRQLRQRAGKTAILVMAMRRDEQFKATCIGAGASAVISHCPAAPELRALVQQLAQASAKPTAPPSNSALATVARDSKALSPSLTERVPPRFRTPGNDRSGSKSESQRMLAPLTWAMDKLAHELNFLTAHDPLTGLINRQEFDRRLKGAVREGKVTGAVHSLLYLDLDQFKLINDTCGHVAGDDHLRQVADVLNQHVRASDTLARLGGDEFALLLYGCDEEPARRIAEQLRETVAALQFNWQQRKFCGSASIGVVTFSEHALNVEQVLSVADTACFLAKERGRNRIHVYRPDDSELAGRLQEMDWVSRVRDALAEQRLTLYAQNIVPIATAAAIAKQGEERVRVEILVRLRTADGTIVPPIAFIPAAERYNLMPAVDRYIITAAFRHLASLTPCQQRRCSYSINLSGATLNDEGFPEFVEQQLAEHNLSAHQFCFEITETIAITNLTQVADVMCRLKQQGVKFALDDFGRGMSSLAYLKHLPVDFIKIDGEFIKNILDDKADRAVVNAIADIARAMGIETVAEFVENDAVLKLLNSLGVDYGQGFGIHKPEPLEERLNRQQEPLALGKAPAFIDGR